VPTACRSPLLIVGSGAIGIEFASFYRTLGAEVTVVEVLPQILPIEDAEIAGLARKSFEKQGIKILTDAKSTKLEKRAPASPPPSKRAANRRLSPPRRHLGAVGGGRQLEHLGLEKLGVQTERASLPFDQFNRDQCAGHLCHRDVSGPRCWRTRPSMRASSASKRSRACTRIR